MEEEQIQSDERLKNLPVQTENAAFEFDQMISCAKCARSNPPNRLKCIYCGAALEISAEQTARVQPNLRKLENWEKGFNLIFQPEKQNDNDFNETEAAKILNLEKDVLRQIVKANRALPLARAELRKEAEIIGERLKENNFHVSVVSDEILAAEKLPTRLRGLEFEDEKLVLIFFNTGEIQEIRRDDLVLIVPGAVYERKTESIEKRKKGESKILDEMEIASDEALIDVYSRENALGFRIYAKGFDFSCLGAEKGILAAENVRKLVGKLREFAPDAKFVNDYATVKEILGNVWEIENRKDSQGLKRHGFGKFDIANVATSSNLQQFTKYSRLQWQIL